MAWPNSLHEAALYGKSEDVKTLIQLGADVNERDGSHRTPLDYCVPLKASYTRIAVGGEENIDAAKKDNELRMALLLLNRGANPNAADRNGWTLLHQCAHNGNLPLLQLAVRKGGNVRLRNHAGQLPVDLAVYRGHHPVVQYLEQQSCDLRSLCRLSVREAMGKRTYNRINELPIPSTIKLFVNHGNPFHGWQATLVPPAPWTSEDLQAGQVKEKELKGFICENGSEEFVQDHQEVLSAGDMQELVEAFQTMYLWEAFGGTVDYEEPLARKPNYSMEMLKKKDGATTNKPNKRGWTFL